MIDRKHYYPPLDRPQRPFLVVALGTTVRWHEFFAIMHYTIHLTTPLLSIEKHLPLPLPHSTTVSNVQKTYYSNVWNSSSTVFHHSWQSYDQRVFNNSMQRFNSILQQLQDSSVQISTENRNYPAVGLPSATGGGAS